MGLLKIANAQPAEVDVDFSVLEAVREMAKLKVGATAVMENGKLVGIFTERDLMMRVVNKEQNLRETKVRDVITKTVLQR